MWIVRLFGNVIRRGSASFYTINIHKLMMENFTYMYILHHKLVSIDGIKFAAVEYTLQA